LWKIGRTDPFAPHVLRSTEGDRWRCSPEWQNAPEWAWNEWGYPFGPDRGRVDRFGQWQPLEKQWPAERIGRADATATGPEGMRPKRTAEKSKNASSRQNNFGNAQQGFALDKTK
jgi:hypothetical protein